MWGTVMRSATRSARSVDGWMGTDPAGAGHPVRSDWMPSPVVGGSFGKAHDGAVARTQLILGKFGGNGYYVYEGVFAEDGHREVGADGGAQHEAL